MNYEHIVKCFESIHSEDVDYFILENKSKYSDKISEYFLTKKLIGYIQFDENIADNAVRFFLSQYQDLLKKYEYITLSDCDLLVDDIKNTFKEIRNILAHDEVGVCAVDLKIDNFPYDIAKPSDWLPPASGVTNDYIECATGGHLTTLRFCNLSIFFDVSWALDVHFYANCRIKGLKWVKTKVNKALHLTWDYYHLGYEYYNFRAENPMIFGQHRLCNYKKLV